MIRKKKSTQGDGDPFVALEMYIAKCHTKPAKVRCSHHEEEERRCVCDEDKEQPQKQKQSDERYWHREKGHTVWLIDCGDLQRIRWRHVVPLVALHRYVLQDDAVTVSSRKKQGMRLWREEEGDTERGRTANSYGAVERVCEHPSAL